MGVTIKAAEAGKHIILGKPMAMSVAQADEMIAAVRKAGVTAGSQGLLGYGPGGVRSSAQRWLGKAYPVLLLEGLAGQPTPLITSLIQ